jgi:mannitol/fructose-specific phosphotransferase system IIA component (Ntr-type)
MLGRTPAIVAEGLGFPLIELPDTADAMELALRVMVDHLVATGKLPPGQEEEALDAVRQREQLGATAVGQALALPHGYSRAVARTVGLVAASKAGVVWPGSLDGQAVHTVCLVLLPLGNRGACRDWNRKLQGFFEDRRPAESGR